MEVTSQGRPLTCFVSNAIVYDQNEHGEEFVKHLSLVLSAVLFGCASAAHALDLQFAISWDPAIT
jgi:hypothetical protein